MRSVLRAVLRRMMDALERVLLRSGYTRKYDMVGGHTHDMLMEDLVAVEGFFTVQDAEGKAMGLTADGAPGENMNLLVLILRLCFCFVLFMRCAVLKRTYAIVALFNIGSADVLMDSIAAE